MATAAAPSRAVTAVPGRRYDKYFFTGMTILMLGVVFAGFARTYFLAGMFRAPLPSLTVHIHGAVFTAWMLLFLYQTSLVATGNVAIHRKLGLWAFGLSCLMVVLGVAAAAGAVARNLAPFADPQTFFAVPMFGITVFAILMAFAYRERQNSATHKRLALLATITIMGAPTGRPPFAVITNHPFLSGAFLWVLIAMLVGYDFFALRKIHKATLWGGLFIIIMDQLTVPIGMTPAWHAFAHAVQTMVRN